MPSTRPTAPRSGRWRTRSAATLTAAAAITTLAALPALAASATHHQARTAITAPPGCPASAPIQGQVWAVTPAQAAKVTFPAPTATPDLTFCTSGIAYIGQWNGPGAGAKARHCFTISTFLDHCGTYGYNLTYSGLPNANLGGTAMTGTTAMSGAKYGLIIEFTQPNPCLPATIQILHDDGVSLHVNGNPVGDFNPGITPPILESAPWTGSPCGNTVDLLYATAAMAARDGAWLEYFPQLY
jgi:hypothetical protein